MISASIRSLGAPFMVWYDEFLVPFSVWLVTFQAALINWIHFDFTAVLPTAHATDETSLCPRSWVTVVMHVESFLYRFLRRAKKLAEQKKATSSIILIVYERTQQSDVIREKKLQWIMGSLTPPPSKKKEQNKVLNFLQRA